MKTARLFKIESIKEWAKTITVIAQVRKKSLPFRDGGMYEVWRRENNELIFQTAEHPERVIAAKLKSLQYYIRRRVLKFERKAPSR